MKNVYIPGIGFRNTSQRFLLIVVTLLLFPCSCLPGQQIVINSGAYLKNSGAAYIRIDNGNLINNGTYIKGTETVNFSGNTANTISGRSNTDMYNLSVTNTGGITTQLDLLTTNNLTIISDSKFTIDTSKTVIVNGSLTNNAGTTGFVIKSDATGDGKLISNSSVNGTVELYLTGSAGTFGQIFHYFIPPVQTMTVGSTITNLKDNLGLTNFNGDLLAYNEPSAVSGKDAGWKYFDNYPSFGTPNFTDLTSARGFNIYLTANDIIKFNGQLNGTAHSFNLDFTSSNPSPGWNLVGNPYPCNYDLNGIDALSNPVSDDVDNTVYFSHNGGYGYWNVETNTSVSDDSGFNYSDIVAPMQGFFVHTRVINKSLILPVAFKTATAAVPLRAKRTVVGGAIKKVKLVLNNVTGRSETVVCLIEKATTGFDGNYDGYKLFGSSTIAPIIYTELNSVRYAINSLQGPISDPVIIPVTVVLKNQGTYEIDITEFENLEGLKVVLRHGAIETTLSKDASYSFASSAGTFTDFELIFGSNITSTGFDNLTNGKLKTWYSNNFLYINCPVGITSDKGSLIIYDIQGKPVLKSNQLYLTPGQTIQLPLTLPEGIYVTHIITNNQPFVSKIVVF